MGYVCLFSRSKQEEKSLVYSVLVILIVTAEYREFPIKSLSGVRACVCADIFYLLLASRVAFICWIFIKSTPCCSAGKIRVYILYTCTPTAC
jgi:hypothetical protein